MAHVKLFCVSLIFLLLAGTRVVATEVMIVDPNTPEAAQAKEQADSIWTADSRLAQQVTYQAHRKTVLNVLNDLSEMTGVTLRAGYNSLDWQVRDRNMFVYAQEMTLGELMQSVARVMKFKWSRSKDEPYTYRLYMDRRTLLQEEGQAYRAEQRFLELQKKKREGLIDAFGELAKMSGPEIEALRDESPYSYAVASSGLAGPLSAMFREIPEFRQAFMEGGDYQTRISDFSPEAQAAVVDAVSALYKACGGTEPLPDDLAQRADKIGIDLSPGVGYDNPALRHVILGALELGCYEPKLGGILIIADPNSSNGKETGKAMLRMMNGASWKDAYASFAVDKEEMESLAAQDFGEARVEHGQDPEMEREIELPAADPKQKESDTREYEKPWDLMLALAKASGCSVVSDYLGGGRLVRLPARVKMIDAMERLQARNFNWWRRGEVLEFRDRYWFRKRWAQIPEKYVEQWREHYEAGAMDIADAIEMSAMLFDSSQYEVKYAVNISGDEVLDDQRVTMAIWQQQGIDSEFFTCLSRRQQGVLESGSSLSTSDLDPEQIEVLKKCVASGEVSGKLSMQVIRGSTMRTYELILWTSEGPKFPGFKAYVPVREKTEP